MLPLFLTALALIFGPVTVFLILSRKRPGERPLPVPAPSVTPLPVAPEPAALWGEGFSAPALPPAKVAPAETGEGASRRPSPRPVSAPLGNGEDAQHPALASCTGIPAAEMTAFIHTVTGAWSLAEGGKVLDGFRTLSAGLQEAGEEEEPWAAEMVALYREAQTCFTAHYGGRLLG